MGILDKLFGGRSAKSSSVANADPKLIFAELVTRIALEHPAVDEAQSNPNKEFSLLLTDVTGEKTWTVNLTNLYAETRDITPQQREARVRGLLSGLSEDPSEIDWSEAEELLVPLLRLQSFGYTAPVAPISRPFLPFLNTFIGIDRDDTIVVATANHEQRWQRPRQQLFDTALAVLGGHAQGDVLSSYDERAPYAIFHCDRDDSYEASRLCVPGYLAAFKEHVDGTPIAIVPHRSALIISGSDNPDVIARLAQIAENEFNAAPRPLSPALYTLDDDDAVVPFEVPDDHPLAALVSRGHRILAATCYADQKELLEERYAAAGRDVFVASLGCLERADTKALSTWTSMAKGVAALLPKADYIALSAEDDGEAWHAMVPWDRFMAVAGDCLEVEAELEPSRYRVVAWPEPSAVVELRESAVGAD